jgi:hypothetical protein
MPSRLRPVPLVRAALASTALALAACSGGGTADAGPAPDQGTVSVVLDTATGSDAVVQYQLAAVVFERADGSATANVLAEPMLVTLADPSGAAAGIALGSVPVGTYTAVHLGLAPGSGVARYGDGTTAEVVVTPDLVVPIRDDLTHLQGRTSWLVIGHDGAPPPSATATERSWQPLLHARPDGADTTLTDLRVVSVSGTSVTATAPLADDRAVEVAFDGACTFDDHPGGRAEFLRGTGAGDTIEVEGTLHRDGSLSARRARRGSRDDGPRLLGRIASLRPLATTFVLDVQAVLQRGGHRELPAPHQVLVDASSARIHASDERRVLAFGDLAPGMLAKVDVARRVQVPGELDVVVAREIEVAASAAPMQPQWQGAVQRVDLTTRTIVVVPRGDDPLVVGGQSVASIDLHVGTEVAIERRERRGPGRTPIRLVDVVPGSDRIWFRGTVTGARSIDASSVRVRDDR